MHSIYKRAVDFYGSILQMLMLVEECGEMVVAISHYRRGKLSQAQLAEHVADLEIMCSQMRVIVGDRVVEDQKQKKLVDLESRLNDTWLGR